MTSPGAQQHTASDPRAASPQIDAAPGRSQAQILLAAFLLILATLAFQHPAAIVRRPLGSFGSDPIYIRALFRFYLLLLAAAGLGWLLYPSASAWHARLHNHVAPTARRQLTYAALAISCLFVSVFLIVAGRQQFGAWDYGALIDLGWRQVLHQRPFVDFITPTPPFFNWTSALAFQLFGVTWNANLYLSALFASGTLVWAYLLLRALGMDALAAVGIAFTMEAMTMLSTDFWWYNNTTLVLAAMFYLSALLLFRKPDSSLAQGSFVLWLALLPLAKPNIAGITIAGCLVLLVLASSHRRRLLLLLAAGTLLCSLFFFATHTSLAPMVATYRGIAKERGGFSAFGFQAMSIGERRITVVWITLLCLPLLSIWKPFAAQLRQRRWADALGWLFFPLAALVAIYGVASNGEMRDVECAVLVLALGLLVFVYRADIPWLRRFVVALFCGMVAANLYAGAARLRVYTIGAHDFFEWQHDDHHFTTGFLQNMTGSDTMAQVHDELTGVLSTEHGHIFLGPRLEFEYAAQQLPSPLHWPTFFHPGTAFDRGQIPTLLSNWQANHFDTLVFIKDEYTYYPLTLIDNIDAQYIRDDRYARLTVYHRRPGA